MPDFAHGLLLWIVSGAGALLVFLGLLQLEQRRRAAGVVAHSRAALLSLGLGLAAAVVSINIDIFRAFVLDILAIIAGAIAFLMINRSNGKLGGALLATVGIVLGGVQAFLVYAFLAGLMR